MYLLTEFEEAVTRDPCTMQGNGGPNFVSLGRTIDGLFTLHSNSLFRMPIKTYDLLARVLGIPATP
jgi:hypothetical protein